METTTRWVVYSTCLRAGHVQRRVRFACLTFMKLMCLLLRWDACGVLQYVQTRREMEEAQMKKYEWEQDQIKRTCLPSLLPYLLPALLPYRLTCCLTCCLAASLAFVDEVACAASSCLGRGLGWAGWGHSLFMFVRQPSIPTSIPLPSLISADMKDYIARFGHGSAKLARQAQRCVSLDWTRCHAALCPRGLRLCVC